MRFAPATNYWARAGSSTLSFVCSHDRDVPGARSRYDLEIGNNPVLDVAFYSSPIGRMELEIRGPGLRPGRQQLDAFSIRLHQHELQGNHARATVVEVRDIIVARPPEPGEALVAVRRKLVDGG